VDRETAVAKLVLVEGEAQEWPDNLSISDEAARGCLYLLAHVEGAGEGDAASTRGLIEAARASYAASRGSIASALAQAVCAANALFCDANAKTAHEERRTAGMTAAVIRGDDLFLAQGGPGVTYRISAGLLQRRPDESPWFEPGPVDPDSVESGAVPLGIRKDYAPDLFHIALNPGDILLFASRTLAHLVNDAEFVSAVGSHQPDEIVEYLRDLAGATDLSAIVVRLPGEPPVLPPPPESMLGAELLEELEKESASVSVQPVESRVAEIPSPGLPSPVARADLSASAPATRPSFAEALAGRVQVDWSDLAPTLDQAASRLLRGLAHGVEFSARAFQLEPSGRRSVSPVADSANLQRVWRLGALLLPILLLAAGGLAWFVYRAETLQNQAAQISQWIGEANAAIDQGNKLSNTDKAAARQAFQKAYSLAQRARDLNPNHPEARNTFYQAEESLYKFNGVFVLRFVPRFAIFPDPRAYPSRIISHWPDVFILDRGTQRLYRYLVDASGSGVNPAPGSTDGIILKAGDKVGERPIGELFDMLWLDSGRLVVLDRTGFFLQYEPIKGTWTSRAASDASQWLRATAASSYLNNLYLLDPSRNQILKYAPGNEGMWTSAVTYLAPEVQVDLGNAVDMAIDGDVWVLRTDGSVLRLASGKPAAFTLRDLDAPLGKTTSLFTSPALVGIYVADAANQRIVQFDKGDGKFVRQFRPGGDSRETFSALKAITVDETNRKFFFINGNQAYMATVPQ
jgi:hypothetical protein